MTWRRVIGGVVPLSLCFVTFARAEELGTAGHGRLRLSVSFAGTAGQLGSEAAYGASLGYRFSQRFAIDVELTGIPNSSRFLGRAVGIAEERAGATPALGSPRGPVEPRTGRQPARGFAPVIAGASTGVGRGESEAILGTANLRAEFRADNERVRPYLTGGFGLAHVEAEIEALEATITPAGLNPRRDGRRGFVFGPAAGANAQSGPVGLAGAGRQTDLAVVLGGGLSVRLAKGLFVDADARYFRLLDPGRNVGRFGGGLSYRF